MVLCTVTIVEESVIVMSVLKDGKLNSRDPNG